MLSHDYWGANISSSASHKSYRPVTVLTFRFNYLTTGLDVRALHGVNVALHAAVAMLVLAIARNALGLAREPALCAALLFAVHPVHVEAVTGVVGRAELLAAAFALAGYSCFAAWCAPESHCRARSASPTALEHAGRALFCALTLALSFLSKETGITVAAIMLAHQAAILWAARDRTHGHRCRNAVTDLAETQAASALAPQPAHDQLRRRHVPGSAITTAADRAPNAAAGPGARASPVPRWPLMLRVATPVLTAAALIALRWARAAAHAHRWPPR